MGLYFSTDVRSYDNFVRKGYHYTKVEQTDDYVIWHLSRDGKFCGYELWKRRMRTNPDGSRVWVVPSSEEFGVYGWYGYDINALKSKLFRNPCSLG